MAEVIVNEQWRSIDGYIDYQVSNCGRVRNATTGKLLKGTVSNHGYQVVNLRSNQSAKTFCVHRIVAHEFVDNHDDKQYVDHIDRNKMNNLASNLRWVTSSENNMNRAKDKRASGSRFKGVHWNVEKKRWRAQIGRKHIGYYDTEEEAAIAYNHKATEEFGDIAHLNEV
jgi:hypothetical protein